MVASKLKLSKQQASEEVISSNICLINSLQSSSLLFTMRRELKHRVLPTDIKFSLGITPFGGVVLAGSQNWFELLNSTKSYFKKEKRPKGELKQRQPAKDVPKVAEEKSPAKKTAQVTQQPKPDSSVSTKPQIPIIHIIRASNESLDSFLNIYLSSSDEDSDEEECGDFVYECPGLAASMEDMTVENPLFNEKLFQKTYRTPELPRKYWKDVFTESV